MDGFIKKGFLYYLWILNLKLVQGVVYSGKSCFQVNFVLGNRSTFLLSLHKRKFCLSAQPKFVQNDDDLQLACSLALLATIFCSVDLRARAQDVWKDVLPQLNQSVFVRGFEGVKKQKITSSILAPPFHLSIIILKITNY